MSQDSKRWIDDGPRPPQPDSVCFSGEGYEAIHMEMSRRSGTVYPQLRGLSPAPVNVREVRVP